MRDMVVKERGASIKLSRAEVIEVRNRYETGGITQAELARQYNVSAAAVSRAVCGGSWHLTDGPIGEKKKHAERSVNLRDPDKVRAIRTAAATEHITYQELAYRFNVSLMTAYNIVKRKTWRHLE
jgi:DNA-binding transcriptional regulator YiaG